jgi:hypothetical protein
MQRINVVDLRIAACPFMSSEEIAPGEFAPTSLVSRSVGLKMGNTERNKEHYLASVLTFVVIFCVNVFSQYPDAAGRRGRKAYACADVAAGVLYE